MLNEASAHSEIAYRQGRLLADAEQHRLRRQARTARQARKNRQRRNGRPDAASAGSSPLAVVTGSNQRAA